jgi:hypothetical protein
MSAENQHIEKDVGAAPRGNHQPQRRRGCARCPHDVRRDRVLCRYGLGLVCCHLSRADAVFLFGAFFFFPAPAFVWIFYFFFFCSVSMVVCKLVMLLLIVYLPVLY